MVGDNVDISLIGALELSAIGFIGLLQFAGEVVIVLVEGTTDGIKGVCALSLRRFSNFNPL